MITLVPPVLGPDAGLRFEMAGAIWTTAIDKSWVTLCLGAPASTTSTLKVNVPLRVGIPKITPLAEMESPFGRSPHDNQYALEARLVAAGTAAK
jgi:hypothetical protein